MFVLVLESMFSLAVLAAVGTNRDRKPSRELSFVLYTSSFFIRKKSFESFVNDKTFREARYCGH